MSLNQINQLEALVKKQGEQIERLHETIYHLLADIYPLQEGANYKKIYVLYNHMKYDKFCDTRWILDEDDDGSDNYNAFFEHRSAEATRITRENCENEEEDFDLSSHSSMPSLVSVSSRDEDKEEPEEPDYFKLPPSSDEEQSISSGSTSSYTRRMRNSAELCGNN
jgi:hypothetical protein